MFGDNTGYILSQLLTIIPYGFAFATIFHLSNYLVGAVYSFMNSAKRF